MTTVQWPKWAEVTREERFFTSHLYHDLLRDPAPFMKILGAKGINISEETCIVDVGYEVCFFRDLGFYNIISRVEGNDRKMYEKMTFDLSLTLSNGDFIIVECKAQQKFNGQQIDQLIKAKIEIENICHDIHPYHDINAHIVGLHSNKYTPNILEINKIACITWADIAEIYPENYDVYNRANEIYDDRRVRVVK